MPRASRGGRSGYQGNFNFYPTSGGDAGSYPSDEEAVADACDEMFSMCGNAGQETLIGDQLDNFEDWALNALEAEGYAMDFDSFREMVTGEWYEGRVDKWQGTNQIWAKGFGHIAQQSGYHDAADEVGEGRGDEFS